MNGQPLAPEVCAYRHAETDQAQCALCWMKRESDQSCRHWDACRAHHIQPAAWADKPVGTDAGFIVGAITGLAVGVVLGAVLL